jgi:hypothetical protein
MLWEINYFWENQFSIMHLLHNRRAFHAQRRGMRRSLAGSVMTFPVPGDQSIRPPAPDDAGA